MNKWTESVKKTSCAEAILHPLWAKIIKSETTSFYFFSPRILTAHTFSYLKTLRELIFWAIHAIFWAFKKILLSVFQAVRAFYLPPTLRARPKLSSGWTAPPAAGLWLNGRNRSMDEQLRPWTNDRPGKLSCYWCWPWEASTNFIGNGQTDRRTNRWTSQLYDWPGFSENETSAQAAGAISCRRGFSLN